MDPRILAPLLTLTAACGTAPEGSPRSAPAQDPAAASSARPDEARGPAPQDPCDDSAVAQDRLDLLARIALPEEPPPPSAPRFGEPQLGPGWVMRYIGWPHPLVPGEEATALWLAPDPPPPGRTPLLIGVQGHFGAGSESDEELRKAELFAQEGWAVLLVVNRGDERGDEPIPAWRRVHGAHGLYAEQRVRRSGRPPIAWDVAAARSALALAGSGQLRIDIDVEHFAVMGVSGGAERAVALAALEPGVSAVVLAAAEYSFSTEQGHAGCTCGALPGAEERIDGEERRARWFRTAGCSGGQDPVARPVLIWDGQPQDGLEAPLRRLGTPLEVRGAAGHGITNDEVVSTWAFLERVILGRERSPEELGRVASELDQSYIAFSPEKRLRRPASTPGAGRYEQGPPPWREDSVLPVAELQKVLALDQLAGSSLPSGWEDLPPADLDIGGRAAEPGAHQPAWIIFDAPVPAPRAVPDGEPLPFRSLGSSTWRRLLGPTTVQVHVTPRVGTSWEDDLYRSRLGSATGLAPLAIPVHDLLAAHAALRLRGDVDPARIAWLGIGAGGPAVLAAAVLVGEGGPVALAHAPVTLWFDGPGQDLADGRRGPRRWVREPFHPWPATLLVGAEGGIAADPWHLAHALHGRLRWLDPRGGDGGPWSEHLPWGRVVESLPELLDDREPANPPPPAP